MADAAAIDPDPTKATAVEEAKIVIADRAQDAPVVEGAADPNQNCRGWAFDQAAQLGDQLPVRWFVKVDQRPRQGRDFRVKRRNPTELEELRRRRDVRYAVNPTSGCSSAESSYPDRLATRGSIPRSFRSRSRRRH